MYKLKCIGFPWDKFDLTTGAYRLGSAPDNEIVLEDPSVAAHHCEIVVTGNTITLNDLSESHETFVDDERVQSTQLKPGQTLRLGTISLLLEGENNVVAGAAPSSQSAKAGTISKTMSWARSPQTVVLLALLLIALVGIAALLYTRRLTGEPGSTPEASARSPDAPKTRAASSSEADGETVPKASGRESPPSSTGPAPLAATAYPAPVAVFNSKETNRPPDLDVKTADELIRSENYAGAEPFLQRALRNQQKSLSGEHPDVTKTLGSLGNLYKNIRQHDKAEPFLHQALNNVQKLRGPEHVETAAALNNLGESYLAARQYDKAAPLLARALEITEKSLPPDDPEAGRSLDNMAALNRAQGEDAKSEPLLEKSLKSLEKAHGPDDPRVGEALQKLGDLHLAMGDPAKAEPLLERALGLKAKSLRPDDPKTANTLKSLGALHKARGDDAKAEPLLQQAAQIAEKAFGPDHPETAASLNNLARLHRKMGQPAKAAPLLQRAAKINEKALGPEHSRTLTSAANQAELSGCQDDPSQSLPLVKQAVQAKFKLLTALVRFGSDQQRLAYRNEANPYELAVLAQERPEMALAILRHKGVVIDSLLEDMIVAQNSRKPEDRALVDRYRTTKNELNHLVFEVPSDLSPKARERREGETQTLGTYLKVLEDKLDRQIPDAGRARRALNVTLEQVKWAVPQQAALVELVRYSRCVGADQWEPCYGAVVLAVNGDPKWVSLGSAEAIERNIADCQAAILGNGHKESPAGGVGAGDAGTDSEQLLSSLLQTLYQQLWAPIEPLFLPDTKTVLISPDSALNVVCFAALLAPNDQFLGQKYSVRYVSSGRDLLGEKKASIKGPAIIFGNPDFSSARSRTNAPASNNELVTVHKPDRRDLQTLPALKLSSPTQEVAQLQLQAGRWNWPFRFFSGAEASEAMLTALKPPRVLQFVRCGYFLPDSAEDGVGMEARRESASTNKVDGAGQGNSPVRHGLRPDSDGPFSGPLAMKNPIHRSGLRLAGAQATLKAWEHDETPPPRNDGIMTAEELGTLKLEGTELVVVSADESGMGAFRSGEVMLALRRAFIQAGAQNLLIGLQAGPEEPATKMLEDFYGRFRGNGNIAQSFADVQRDWLVRLRKEQGLAIALRAAGSFIMSSNGPMQ